MDNRIGFQTPRNLRLAAGILLLALAWPGAALAFKSAYSSITVPGSFDSAEWDTASHELALVSDYVWEGLVKVEKAGEFKFAANKSWAVSWGLGQDVSAVPTVDMGPLNTPDNIRLKIPAGTYRFVFFEDTSTFSVLPASSTPPSYSKVQLVGNFNNDGALTNGTMAAAGNGVWTVSGLDLSHGATIRVQADGTVLGAHSAQGASLSSMPAAVALYGTTEAVLESAGGTFSFTVDFRSNLLSVVQTAVDTNFTFAAAGADGTFACGDKTPGQNLENAGDNWWSGDFQVGQDRFTLRFVGRDTNGVPGRWWGFPANTTITTLPAEGALTAADAASGAPAATFNTGAGDYTFRFNPQSGSYTVRKRALSNLFANASFEQLDGDGNPANWGLYHAVGAPAAAYDAHSGTNSAVLNRLYDDWDNLGNIDQSVTLKGKEGLPFRVSAAFRCGGSAWHGDTVRIIIEWKDSRDTLLSEESTEVLNLSPAWQTVALDTTVPGSNVTAHVLFKYDGAQTGETVLIDDAYAGIAASRTQNFDAWGKHDDFGPLSPDWTASSAKTILNAGEKVVGGVVISKYIESTGNTKAIELYNGTASNINFRNEHYYLQQYDNGSTTPTVTIPLTNGTFYAGRCWRITRRFDATNYPPDKALKAANYCTTNNLLTFNGDDVIVLRKGTASGRVVDRVGQVSEHATGSLWSRMATDHTLVRNSTVTNGNTSPVTAAFDLSEWTVLDNGDFTGLGTHAFTDPDAGYLPSGYSLLLDTGANLATPSLEGGIGDIAFLARAQGATNGTALQLAVETAPDEYSSSWTTVATVSIPLSQTDFTRYECSAGNSAHTVVRFRHIADSTTNRIRLDDIEIGRAYRIKRTENFAGWTDPAYRTDGLHSVAQWTVNGRVADNGVSGTLAANLPVDSGSVQTPTFDGGVGQITFALCRPAATDSVQVTLSTSADGGATWDEVQTFDFPSTAKGTSTNLSAWVYVPSNGCARFECTGGTADAILDNISVGMPSIAREINFDDFAAGSNYQSFPYKGWTVTDTAVNNSANAWSGNSGLMRNGVITSPYIDPIGSISFMYRMGVSSGDDKARLKVEVSADAKTWTTLTASLAGTDEWQSYGYWFPTNSAWHHVRISQTTKDKRFFIDDISLNDRSEAPFVLLSSSLDPSYPGANESFRLAASAYPHNGAEILSVTGYVKYASSGRFSPLAMTYGNDGRYLSDPQTGRAGGSSVYYYATVWYGGVGVVPGNPGYAVTNLSTGVANLTIDPVPHGSVWINEINYERLVPDDDETDDWGIQWNQDHEFIELCGPAGTNIGNWKIELAYALAADIAENGGTAIYATYTIPPQTVFPDDGGSKFGFYLLGDEYITNAVVNQKLTTLVPADDPFEWGIGRSHIRDGAGVIRLLNQYGGVVQSIAYGAYADTSEHLPVKQSTGVDNNYTLALTSSGNNYSAFQWSMLGATPGAANPGQGFIVTNRPPMPVWHDPNLAVTTRLQGAFALFNPAGAPQSAAVQVFYAYPTNVFSRYNSLNGTLYHRNPGTTPWSAASKVGKQNDFSGNFNPTNGDAYFAFLPIAPYAYARRDTMEYVIAASSDGGNYSETFLGSTGDGVTCTNYETLAEAQAHPFTHYFPVADVIEITGFEFASDGAFLIHTTGNDSLDRLSEFNVLSTTNLAEPVEEWEHLDFSRDGFNEDDTFTITDPPASPAHFAIQPVR